MAMQKLNVRFSDETKNILWDISVDLKMEQSIVARAALNIGLDILREESIKAKLTNNFSKVNGLVSSKQ